MATTFGNATGAYSNSGIAIDNTGDLTPQLWHLRQPSACYRSQQHRHRHRQRGRHRRTFLPTATPVSPCTYWHTTRVSPTATSWASSDQTGSIDGAHRLWFTGIFARPPATPPAPTATAASTSRIRVTSKPATAAFTPIPRQRDRRLQQLPASPSTMRATSTLHSAGIVPISPDWQRHEGFDSNSGITIDNSGDVDTGSNGIYARTSGNAIGAQSNAGIDIEIRATSMLTLRHCRQTYGAAAATAIAASTSTMRAISTPPSSALSPEPMVMPPAAPATLASPSTIRATSPPAAAASMPGPMATPTAPTATPASTSTIRATSTRRERNFCRDQRRRQRRLQQRRHRHHQFG